MIIASITTLLLVTFLCAIALWQSFKIDDLELLIDDYERAERNRKNFAKYLRNYKYLKNNTIHIPEDMFDLIVKKMEGE